MPYRLAIAHYQNLLFLKDLHKYNSLLLGWIKGFEPLASRATIWRANQLRYTHHKVFSYLKEKMCQKGFEPPTTGLEGRCSIQLSY